MADLSQIGGGDAPQKSFWSKPEGVTSLLFLGAAGAVGLYYFNKIVEFLIKVTENTLYLGALLAVLGLFVFLITSKDVRTAAFFLFKTTMRKIAGLVIQLDPIAIMKIYIEDLKEKRQ